MIYAGVEVRGQTYDSGANMAGILNGCQAVMRRKCPLALHFHCAAHCVHLVAQHAAESDVLVRDCLQWVHELGKLYRRSMKFNSIFNAVDSERDGNSSTPAPAARIKPLCLPDGCVVIRLWSQLSTHMQSFWTACIK